jgi:hypothetical protein
MRALLFVCAALLFIGIADLPIGYYTFLRIVVAIGSVLAFLEVWEKKQTGWMIFFGLSTVLFNPIFPVYLHDKETWIAIDFAIALIFTFKAFTSKPKQPQNE